MGWGKYGETVYAIEFAICMAAWVLFAADAVQAYGRLKKKWKERELWRVTDS